MTRRVVSAREQVEMLAPWLPRLAISQADLDDYRWERQRQEDELEAITGGHPDDIDLYFARGGKPLITFRDWISGRGGGEAEREAWESSPDNDGEMYVPDPEVWDYDDTPEWAKMANSTRRGAAHHLPRTDPVDGVDYPLQGRSTADLINAFDSLRSFHQDGEDPPPGHLSWPERIDRHVAEILDRAEAGDPDARTLAERHGYLPPAYMSEKQWQENRSYYPEDYPSDPRYRTARQAGHRSAANDIDDILELLGRPGRADYTRPSPKEAHDPIPGVPPGWEKYVTTLQGQPDRSGQAHLRLPTEVLDHYKEYDRDPTTDQAQALAYVLRADGGVRNPVHISTDGETALMHEGNNRLSLAKQFGWSDLPVNVTYEPPGQVIRNGGTPVPLEPHLADWLDQNSHTLKSFFKGGATLRRSMKSVEDPEYVYHATHDLAAQDIKDDGYLDVHDPWYGTDQDAWPDGSLESRSYWSHAPAVAESFYPEGGQPTLLRVPRDSADFRRESTGDLYTTAPVPADLLEVHAGDSHWLPLRDW